MNGTFPGFLASWFLVSRFLWVVDDLVRVQVLVRVEVGVALLAVEEPLKVGKFKSEFLYPYKFIP